MASIYCVAVILYRKKINTSQIASLAYELVHSFRDFTAITYLGTSYELNKTRTGTLRGCVGVSIVGLHFDLA